MSYTLTQKEFSTLKSRLTRCINVVKRCEQNLNEAEYDRKLRQALVSAALKLRNEVTHAKNIFDDKGWPDAWHRWEIAHDDAVSIMQRCGAALKL